MSNDRIVVITIAATTAATVTRDAMAGSAIAALSTGTIIAASLGIMALGACIGWAVAWTQMWLDERRSDRESEMVMQRLIALERERAGLSNHPPLHIVRDRFDSESA